MWHSIFSWSSFFLELTTNSMPVKWEKRWKIGDFTSIPWLLLSILSLNIKVLYVISSTVYSTSFHNRKLEKCCLRLRMGHSLFGREGDYYPTHLKIMHTLLCPGSLIWIPPLLHFWLVILKENLAPLSFGKPSLFSWLLKGDMAHHSFPIPGVSPGKRSREECSRHITVSSTGA